MSGLTPESTRAGIIKETKKGSIIVEYPILEGESIVDTQASFRKPTPPATAPSYSGSVSVILSKPFSPFANEAIVPKHFDNELVLKLPYGDPLSGFEIKNKLAEAHNIPPHSVVLYEDPGHKKEIHDHEKIHHTAIYWAFEGDAPSSWYYKRELIENSLDRIKATVTENMKTASFLLEKEYIWDKALTYDQQKKSWEDMNLITVEHHDLPKLPLLVGGGSYKTSPKEIKEAYYRLNPGWKETLDRVKERIIAVRTDKEQYERNLRNLEKNDHTLRDEIKSFTGKLIPPFPDTNLYSSIFFTPEIAESSDLTWKMLLGTIDANTLYYHQELGKYNILKKEECHLASVYMQLTTRMKLWIFRERIRQIDWEMKNSDLFKDEPVSIHLREALVTKAAHYEVPDKRKRSYQCIDFCQCELGCSLKFISEAPALVKGKEKK